MSAPKKQERAPLCPNHRKPMERAEGYLWRCDLCAASFDVRFKVPNTREGLS